MTDFQLSFEFSPWYILLFLLLAYGGAWLVYGQKHSWSRYLNRLLFSLRFLSIALIGFLILAPYIKFIKNEFEKPIVALVVDNSISIVSSADSLEVGELAGYIKSFRSSLEDQYDVRVFNLKGNYIENPDSLHFDVPLTNIVKAGDEVFNLFRSDNFAELVIISDGIYNRGISPAYKSYPFSVSTVGTGDSSEIQDVKVSEIRYNRIAYQGNSYPLEVLINNNGYYGEKAQIKISRNGEIIQRKSFDLGTDGFEHFQFSIDAAKSGLQKIDVQVVPFAQESNTANNVKSAFVEVIDGKQQILIAAAAPHPDIKMIRTVLESGDNYDVSVFIDGIDDYVEKKYDLIVLHGLPERRTTVNVRNLFNSKTPKWIITGPGSDLATLGTKYGVLPRRSRNTPDKVTGIFNQQYSKYRLDDDIKSSIESYPPLSVPFGDYSIPTDYEALLYQRIGSLGTERPLWVVGSREDVKISILAGEGIWRWRLDEFSRNGSTNSFDPLVRKTVQYLASKDDRKRLKVYPLQKEYSEGERVSFRAEFYNAIYEKEYGVEIYLRLSSGDSSLSYNFTYSEFSDLFEVGTLPAGLYSYSASTASGSEQFEDKGQFIVSAQNLEKENLKADFQLLREMAGNSKGQFYYLTDFESLIQDLIKKDFPDLIHTEERLLSLIDIHWILLFLISIIALEWFLRKFYGKY